MKKNRVIPLFLIVCICIFALAPSAYALDNPSLMSAQAVVVAEVESGRILYSMNMNDQRAPASLTKIMTVLVAIEAIENGEASLDDMVVAKNDCREGLNDDSSTCGIVAGEEMRMEDLLYCAMVHSANEACNIIASQISGSVSAFVERMNARAAEIGCTCTHFSNTNGLPADDHYSSAYDFYLITRQAMKYPLFMTISNTAEYTVPATNVAAERVLSNSNALICADSMYGSNYIYQGAEGIKTGYTRSAGYCLISTAKKNDIHVMTVVMGCNGVLNSQSPYYENFDDTIRLYDWTFENFSYKQILSSDKVIQKVTAELTEEGTSVRLFPAENLSLLLPNDIDLTTVGFETDIYDELLVAPIASGTELGEVTVFVGPEAAATVKLINTTAVEMAKKEFISRQIKSVLDKAWVKTIIIVLVILFILYIITVARYRARRRRALQKRREAERKRAAKAAAYQHSTQKPSSYHPRNDNQTSDSELNFDGLDFSSGKDTYW